MTGEPQEPEGQPTSEPEPEQEGTPDELQETSQTNEATSEHDEGQANYVPKKDYDNLESRFGRSQTELKASQTRLEEKVSEFEKFQQQVKDSFSPRTPDVAAQKRLSSAELRSKAQLYRDEGYEDSAIMYEELAENADFREKIDGNITTEQQFHSLWNELSKEGSHIDPQSVDFGEVAKIAAENKVGAKAAYGIWLSDNFNKLTSSAIEQEKTAWDKANRARGIEGDYDIPVTDAEKKEIAKERAEIGEPGKWPVGK